MDETLKTRLEHERDLLCGMYDRLHRKIKAIDALLEPDEESAPPPSMQPGVPALGTDGHVRNGRTFAARIRQALTELGRPAKPAQVIAWLQKHGVNGPHVTQLRVSSELYRMATRHTGGVIKVHRGVYAIRIGDD